MSVSHLCVTCVCYTCVSLMQHIVAYVCVTHAYKSANGRAKKKKVSEDKRMVDTKESLKARMNLQVVCVCARARACERACVRACVCVCVCVCVSKVCVCA
jgi:hypothetical protein